MRVRVRQGTAQALQMIRAVAAESADDAAFREVYNTNFVFYRSDSSRVALCPGGEQRQVGLDNYEEYCAKLLHMRMTETRSQYEALARGVGDVIPLALLRLFAWDEVQLLICGKPEVDLTLLQRCTQYDDGLSAESPRVKVLWEALEGFDHAERSKFLEFCWGRSRLPLEEAQFDKQFNVRKMQEAGDDAAGKADKTAGEDPDSRLPNAFTCFFRLHLPAYSSAEACQRQLRYAMHNCKAMDNDFAADDNDAWREL